MPQNMPGTHHQSISALLVEDDPFVLAGVRTFLETHGFTTREAGDAASALRLLHEAPPDVAVVDISIPPTPTNQKWPFNHIGIEFVKQLKTAYPDIGVVLLSAYDGYLMEFEALLQRDIRGIAYQLKGRRSLLLLEAIRKVMDGHVIVDPETQMQRSRLTNAIWEKLSRDEHPWVKLALDHFDELTQAEQRAAHLLAASHNTQGIAEKLHIRRVDTLVSRVYSKLGLDNLPTDAPHLRQISILVKACLLHDLQQM